MNRSTPLTRKQPLRRRVRVKPRNARRAARRRAEAFGPQAKLCEASRCPACLVAGRPDCGRVVAHHEHSRGAGGKDEATVPLGCPCHSIRHNEGPSFWNKRGIDVSELLRWMRSGRVVDAAWLQRHRMDSAPVDFSLGGTVR